MNRKSRISRFLVPLASAILMTLMSCSQEIPTDLSKASIIPRPVSVSPTGESFTVKENTGIYVLTDNQKVAEVAEMLSALLKPLTGYGIEVKTASGNIPAGNIVLSLEDGLDTGSEGYILDIAKKQISVKAETPAGLFYAVQTIRQLLPAAVESSSPVDGPVKIASGAISDKPVYAYRGSMLDVSRHFFSVEDVKRYVDFLAAYKMNVLHLHLSDDQGWRIEIKSWPNLATHGGSKEVGGGEGGYYTQEQYTDIVNYAAARHITIVPEIDMPGHTNAALASYAELNKNKKATELYTGTEVGFSTLDTRSELTYKFIDDVIRELAALTPGEYIHIGGDESHSTKKDDYIYFMNRVQDIVTAYGKKVLAWDEIALATVKPGTIAQVWASVENANLAVGQGAKVLMSPARKAYLDMQYHKDTPLGLHWAAYIEVDTAYIWDPATYIPGIEQDDIVGVEAPLWSETVTNIDEVEFMVFPRLPGYAEIGWTPAELRNWDEYKLRLAAHGERFTAAGINYYASEKVPWPAAK
ncbi:MAG: beta-N-acetylhexosaminidase [Bacteroidales bacterium]|nr:beta-N-acetylhexosaminidase [Bacteroidales bacterium]